jgi:hypothetical protein
MKVASIVLALAGTLGMVVASGFIASVLFPRDRASIETWGVAFEILAGVTAVVAALCFVGSGLAWRAYKRRRPVQE